MNASRSDMGLVVGWSAIIFSATYWISDVWEAGQGGFSDGQLCLTLISEAAIPPIILGIWWLQRDDLGRIGQVSAWAYAYAYTFFTFTVVYALLNGTPSYDVLGDDLGAAMLLHGAIMLVAGIGFGVAVVRSGMLPAWTGWALAVGVVLVVATQGAPDAMQLIASGVREAAIAGMGLALIRLARGAEIRWQ